MARAYHVRSSSRVYAIYRACRAVSLRPLPIQITGAFAAMESTDEGGGGGELGLGLGLGFAGIDAVAEGLARSEVFHIVKEVMGFVLYMHHQIPSVLQSLENEFVALKEELKNLVDSGTMPAETKASDQRKHNLRKREVKQGIKRQEKLMNGISSLLSALQDALNEVPSIQGVTLVLGGSLARPLHVYDMLFSNGSFDSGRAKECAKNEKEGNPVRRRGRPRKASNLQGKKLFDRHDSSDEVEDSISGSEQNAEEEEEDDEDEQQPLIHTFRSSMSKLRSMKLPQQERNGQAGTSRTEERNA